MHGKKPGQWCWGQLSWLGMAGNPMQRPCFRSFSEPLSRFSSTSAEGYAFGESRTYMQHLRIAYGSAVETGELLETALKANVIGVDPGVRLLTRNRRSQRLLLGMLRSK